MDKFPLRGATFHENTGDVRVSGKAEPAKPLTDLGHLLLVVGVHWEDVLIERIPR